MPMCTPFYYNDPTPTGRPPRGEAVCVECLIGKQNKSTLFQVTDTVTYSQNYDSVKTVKTCEWYELSEKG
jgi:hypothetical protein